MSSNEEKSRVWRVWKIILASNKGPISRRASHPCSCVKAAPLGYAIPHRGCATTRQTNRNPPMQSKPLVLPVTGVQAHIFR
jgi:hypothetical protein